MSNNPYLDLNGQGEDRNPFLVLDQDEAAALADGLITALADRPDTTAQQLDTAAARIYRGRAR